MRSSLRLLLLAAGVLAGACGLASRAAAGFAAVEFATTTTTNTFFGGNASVGYRFQVNSPLFATALGFYDAGGDGLARAHAVGLYTDAGAQLAAGTVSNSDALLGHFRYTAVAPVALAPGFYRVAGLVYDGDQVDTATSRVTGLTTAPGLTYINGAVTFGPTVQSPADFTVFSNGIFGGSLMVEPVTTATPAPAGALVLAAAAGLLGLARRLRSAAA